MLYYVVGEKGTGKSQYLIDEANKEKDNDVSNVVFIESEKEESGILDHKVRLINAKSYKVNCTSSLRGFIAGILARDFDIGKVYVDGIYRLVDINKDNIEKLTNELSDLSEYAKTDIYLSLDWSNEELPEGLKAEIIEINK